METLQTRGIRPASPYDLGTPWGDNRIPSTGELGGREISITRDDAVVLECSFDRETVSWRYSDDQAEGSAPYDAVALREGVYFIQFLHDGGLAATSLALNLRTNAGVLAQNRLVHGAERTDLQQDLYPCAVTGSDGTLPELSAELVGRRAYAEYADGHTAEHLYLNPRRFAWQGLGKFDYSGSECDQSTTWKLDDKLYLLTWVEDWQAVGAVLLLDFEQLLNVGVIFGQDDIQLRHTLCGARLEILSEVEYPPGYEPPGVLEPKRR